MTKPTSPIPIATIGGFLGSGKTTLVNRILKDSSNRRIVIFVNDFGELNIDYDLIETVEEDRISLSNGCVCCTLNNDLLESVVDYCRHPDRPDAFVVEASGIADPRSLDHSIFSLVSAGFVQFDSRTYVLDTDRFGTLDYADTELLVDHAVTSDLILMNKVDLATNSQRDTLRTLLTRSAPRGTILETSHAAIPMELLFGGQSLSEQGQSHPVTLDHGFESWSTRVDTLLDKDRFLAFLPTLSSMALRAKGRLFFANAPEIPVKFDLVGGRHTFELMGGSDDGYISSFVAIGRTEVFRTEALKTAFEELKRGYPSTGKVMPEIALHGLTGSPAT